MAYNNQEDPKKNASILAQVSFKEASRIAVATLDMFSDDGRSKFEELQAYLFESLCNSVSAAKARAAGGNAVNGGQTYGQARQAYDAEQAIRDTFPGTTDAPNGGLTVENQQGDIPDWLVQAASKAGVVSVRDQRADAAGTKKPLFVATDGTKDRSGKFPLGFWPPRD